MANIKEVEQSHFFDNILEKARSIKEKVRVVVAGADVENILRGIFQAEAEGFVKPILVGNGPRIKELLKKHDLLDRSYDLIEVNDDVNVVQYSIDMIHAGAADVLMRGNTQTRDFLMPIISKQNHLLRPNVLLTHVVMMKIPECEKITAISDVTILVKPSQEQQKEVIKNMVEALKIIGVKDPKIALLSLTETPSFHMKDTVQAQNIVKDQERNHFADCTLVGPISYDLIVSKEAARLKGYNCEYCGQFDGIVVPDLMSGNLIIKCLQMSAWANSFGVIVGATVPIAITSRSDSAAQAFLSAAACSVMARFH